MIDNLIEDHRLVAGILQRFRESRFSYGEGRIASALDSVLTYASTYILTASILMA